MYKYVKLHSLRPQNVPSKVRRQYLNICTEGSYQYIQSNKKVKKPRLHYYFNIFKLGDSPEQLN